MTQSTRKFVGTLLTIVALVLYVALGSQIYEWFLVGQPGWLLIIYFAIAGLGWLLPAMAIIKWMARPD